MPFIPHTEQEISQMLQSIGNAVAIEQMVLQNEGWERDVEVPEPTQT